MLKQRNLIILLLCIFIIFAICLYKQSFENFQSNQKLPRVIYTFWTGTNPLTENRKNALDSIKEKSGCEVKLITKDNLDSYILKDHPLHAAYPYLSEVHKCDYLRTYFMHHYGGGYSDIKMTTGDWNSAFDDMDSTTTALANGYPEVGPDGVGYEPYREQWKSLIGNCAYIFRPNTDLTREWYNEMMQLLDGKLEDLKKHPATHPRAKREEGNGYPIGWIEMLGEIFHRVSLKHAPNILMTVPIPVFHSYI